MTDWITLQDVADMISVKKGTLCMWRLRDRFPFRTRGKGRGLLVSKNSVERWQAAGGKANVRRGRPGRKKKTSYAARSAVRTGPASTGKMIKLSTSSSLPDIQDFVAALKSGKNVNVLPEKKGFVLTLRK